MQGAACVSQMVVVGVALQPADGIGSAGFEVPPEPPADAPAVPAPPIAVPPVPVAPPGPPPPVAPPRPAAPVVPLPPVPAVPLPPVPGVPLPPVPAFPVVPACPMLEPPVPPAPAPPAPSEFAHDVSHSETSPTAMNERTELVRLRFAIVACLREGTGARAPAYTRPVKRPHRGAAMSVLIYPSARAVRSARAKTGSPDRSIIRRPRFGRGAARRSDSAGRHTLPSPVPPPASSRGDV